MSVASPAGVAAPNAGRLAEFVAGLEFEALPPEVLERARWVLADTVGCMLGGAATALGAAVVDVLAPLAGRDEATIVGTPHRADCVTAAFANAVLADALDYEDTLIGHPSAAAVPAALAVGEYAGASGREVLTAIVAGYEVGVRVARAIAATPERARQVAVTYAWHGFCAAAAAGRGLGLGLEPLLDAFGYVGASSPLPVWLTKWGRPVHWLKQNFGEQTRAGVLAALMARGGVPAPRLMLDSDLGFWRMVGSDRYRPDELTRDLGERWAILDTTFKPYPACRFIHTALDAIRALREEHELDPRAVDRVVVRSFGEMVDWFGDRRPQTMVDAEFSVPYVAALALLGREPGVGWYDSAALRDPEVLALADRVDLERDEECEALFWSERRYAAVVEVTTREGRRLRARRDWARGGREVPLSDDEMSRKFLDLARPGLPAGRAERLLADLRAIDRCPDVRPVARALAAEV